MAESAGTECSIDRCGSAAVTRGWCRGHYRRWQRWGSPTGTAPAKRPWTCTIDGCERPGYSREMCSLHYNRWYLHGDPQRTQRSAQLEREQTSGTRVCTVCGEEKPLDQFRPSKRSLNGRLRECKSCFSSRVKSWYLDSGKHRVRTNSRRNHLLRKYGLTADAFESMIAEQEGQCAACHRPDERLFVDHNHKTGRVRELLCHQCNLALGMMQDSTERLRELIKYLERHSG